MKHFKGELVVAAVFLALLFVLFNPWHIFMPTYVERMLLAALLVAFGAFVAFIWRENPADEREALHRLYSDRLAFLAGAAILLAMVIVGEWRHQLDPWVLLALGAMILAKTAGLIYTKIRL